MVLEDEPEDEPDDDELGPESDDVLAGVALLDAARESVR